MGVRIKRTLALLLFEMRVTNTKRIKPQNDSETLEFVSALSSLCDICTMSLSLFVCVCLFVSIPDEMERSTLSHTKVKLSMKSAKLESKK